eukprot:210511-Chlamydomonas_euryale.AAC.1
MDPVSCHSLHPHIDEEQPSHDLLLQLICLAGIVLHVRSARVELCRKRSAASLADHRRLADQA